MKNAEKTDLILQKTTAQKHLFATCTTTVREATVLIQPKYQAIGLSCRII
jgi:hypothetical protein